MEEKKAIKKTKPWKEYPVGTKAPSVHGGYWTRVQSGWNWPMGGTFPTPGGDNNGMEDF